LATGVPRGALLREGWDVGRRAPTFLVRLVDPVVFFDLWRVLPATARVRGSHAPVWRFLGNPPV